MKRLVGKIMVLVLMFVLSATLGSAVNASLNDTKGSIDERYGEAWYALGKHGEQYTMTEWLAQKEDEKKKAVAFVYKTKFDDVGAQITVKYEEYNISSSAFVRAERINFDFPIKIKEFQKYLPSEWAVVTGPKAKPFIDKIKKFQDQFEETSSPLAYGVVIEDYITAKRKFYPVYAFNIVNEGVWVTKPEMITPDTYIKEIIISQVDPGVVKELYKKQNADWEEAKNYFLVK